ncbi:MAG: potassium channel beta subunit family protein [Anaerolineaceae bacterium]
MNYRKMGKSGLRLSELSLGAWVTFGNQVDEAMVTETMKTAYEAGMNFFDNAETYADGQAEVVMGRVLKKLGWRRESYVVSTKIFWGGDGPNDEGLSYKHVVEGANNALRRLQLDYVDLIFCHRPDPDTPIEETVRAMDLIIRQGKAFYWGTSEWCAADIMKADAVARQCGLTPPSMEQPQYHMLHRRKVEQEFLPLYRELGLGLTTWSPLASGLLSGKYNDGIPAGSRATLPGYEFIRDRMLMPWKLEKVKQLVPVAADLGCTMAQLAIAWCLKNPNVSTVLTGASRLEQLKQNLGALEVVGKMDDGVMTRLDEILDNNPLTHD